MLEAGDIPERFGRYLNGALREELKDYADEELLNVNAIYLWKKPGD